MDMCTLLKSIFIFFACAACALAESGKAELSLFDSDNGKGVKLSVGGKEVLSSDGLWKIGIGWKDESPEMYFEANASSEKTLPDGSLVLEGSIKTPDGVWKMKDVYERISPSAFKCSRRAVFEGKNGSESAVLVNSFEVSSRPERCLLPSLYYYGNPSGVKNAKIAVPGPSEKLLVEEHRLPMPFAMAEIESEGKIYGAAIHTIPSPVPFSKQPDTWWTLGFENSGKGKIKLTSSSGPLSCNGQDGAVKSGQRKLEIFKNACMSVPDGAVIEKTFFLQAYPVDRRGDAAGEAVAQSLEIFKPYYAEDLPSREKIVSKKLEFAKSRWIEKGEACGFEMYPKRSKKRHLVFGWCGQAAAVPLAFQCFSKTPEDLDKVQKTLDFLSSAKFSNRGFTVVYDLEKGVWQDQFTKAGDPDWLSQGQGMFNMALNIEYAKKEKKLNTKKWEDFLLQASEFHSRRILSPEWKTVSTSEAFFAAPLAKAHRLFGKEEFKSAALKVADYYASRHLSMDEPYWGGTLDARCEDKEGAWGALQAFMAAYELSGDKKYLDYAKHASDIVLSYTMVWDVPFNGSRLGDAGFKSRGWTAVSPQNNHLDVYGVLYTPVVKKLGKLLKRPEYEKLAEVMYRSCGQLMDENGSQGEQIQQTNFGQFFKNAPLQSLRGGYAEQWTVLWITAHFLVAAAEEEMPN